MNKNELYEKLLKAFKDHSNKNTLQTTYVNRVLRIVKDYLQYDSLKQAFEILKDKFEIDLWYDNNFFTTPEINIGDEYAYLTEKEYELLKEVLYDRV